MVGLKIYMSILCSPDTSCKHHKFKVTISTGTGIFLLGFWEVYQWSFNWYIDYREN